MKERLQKIIADSGLTSRRKAEKLIEQGRVSVNGTVVTELGTKADPAKDAIEVDGDQIDVRPNKIYVMLNKPPGHICSLTDPEGRPTVTKLIADIPERLYPVGRLDYDTEGLLILTNDGTFSQTMQHPRHNIPRMYKVKVKSVPKEELLKQLRRGIVIDGVKTNRCWIKIIEKTRKNAWLEVVLKEGRNRQIKQMFERIKHPVLRIVRVAFGPLELGSLPQGQYRFLKKKEIEAIMEKVKG